MQPLRLVGVRGAVMKCPTHATEMRRLVNAPRIARCPQCFAAGQHDHIADDAEGRALEAAIDAESRAIVANAKRRTVRS